MTTRLALLAAATLVCSACAPDEVSVHDDIVFARVRITGIAEGLHARVDVFVEDYDAVPPLSCRRLAAGTWISLGGQRLDIATLGGVDAGGYCEAASAGGVLPPAALATAVTVELGDDSGSRAAPLWDALAPRSAQLSPPPDGILRAGVPFVIQWSPDPYGFLFRAELVDAPGLEVEIISVAGNDITAQLVEIYQAAPDPDARPALIIHAEAGHDPPSRGFVTRWIESWSIELPVTIERAPPSPAP